MTDREGMIPCSDAVRQLWDYLDRTLPAERHADVERHLAFCRRCCGEMEFAKQLQGVLAEQGSDEMPDDVRTRFERLIDEL